MIGGVAKDTLQGPTVDQPLARSGRYFTPNHLGSTTTLTDGGGTVVQSYTYGPFGETTGTGSEVQPFQYAGRERDESGLYYNRARYYRPEWGRFISEDPIGLAGGDNLYVYAGNNPLDAIDPTGTNIKPLSDRELRELAEMVAYERWRTQHPFLDRVLTFIAVVFGQGPPEFPKDAFTGKDAPERAYRFFGKEEGISKAKLSGNLHRLKKDGGLAPNDNVVIGRDGTVWNEKTGDVLGSILDG